MITDESTTMPKSTAPSEMRLACVPVDTMPKNAKSNSWLPTVAAGPALMPVPGGVVSALIVQV